MPSAGGPYKRGVGKLRDRVQLHSPVRGRKTSGQATIAFALIDTVFASVAPLSGRELYQARQVRLDVAYRVELRYRADLAADWRIVWAGKTLEVVAVPPSGGTHGAIVALCAEVP